MIIKENQVIEYHPALSYYANCSECFSTLQWECHDPGNLQGEKWIAFCKCNKSQRLWTLRANTYVISSINGK